MCTGALVDVTVAIAWRGTSGEATQLDETRPERVDELQPGETVDEPGQPEPPPPANKFFEG